MMEPIKVTPTEFWTIMWMVYVFAWFHVASVIFAAPHEREEYENF